MHSAAGLGLWNVKSESWNSTAVSGHRKHAIPDLLSHELETNFRRRHPRQLPHKHPDSEIQLTIPFRRPPKSVASVRATLEIVRALSERRYTDICVDGFSLRGGDIRLGRRFNPSLGRRFDLGLGRRCNPVRPNPGSNRHGQTYFPPGGRQPRQRWLPRAAWLRISCSEVAGDGMVWRVDAAGFSSPACAGLYRPGPADSWAGGLAPRFRGL